jgi:type 1 glutamine amidotransferase
MKQRSIRFKKRNCVRALFCVAVLFTAMTLQAKKPVKVMILTGQNNHGWQKSSVMMQEYLTRSGLFEADIVTSPPKGADMSVFKPDFSAYRAVILDYNGEAWPEDTQSSFLAYVENGGGVVVYHAADNAFSNWKEYSEIIGLGWGVKDGHYVYWSDGKMVEDFQDGPAGKHGKQHAFTITVRDKKHPVMKGLPESWLHPQDELYDSMRGPAKNMTVLATAFSSVDEGGSGRHEPALMTIRRGKGRIFHTILGHVWREGDDFPGMESVSFITTFLRGTEWAATGKVTWKGQVE